MIKGMPNLPIPPVMRGMDAGSFAEDTIVRRLPEIALRVLSENRFDETTNQRLRRLADDLPHGRIRPLLDGNAPDWPDWQTSLQPFLGQTWLEAPLFAAEIYFYRRILEATGYFQPGVGYGLDPYRQQKGLGLAQAGSTIAQTLPPQQFAGKEQLRSLILMSLWGNQADLSLWPVQGDSGGRAQGGGGETHLVADQSAAALPYIMELADGRVDMILDNSGTELLIDLLLADALLALNPSFSLRLHVKPHPVFVSDAIAADVTQALSWLKNGAHAWAQPAAQRLEQAERDDRIQVTSHYYWASPYPAWMAPPDLWAELAGSKLLVSKGDVNYRRWLGDACWVAATPLEAIINPPAPLLLLRVSKSETVAGLAPGQADALFARDPSWHINGHWGMVQFVMPKKQN
jgi:hypothetical protein